MHRICIPFCPLLTNDVNAWQLRYRSRFTVSPSIHIIHIDVYIIDVHRHWEELVRVPRDGWRERGRRNQVGYKGDIASPRSSSYIDSNLTRNGWLSPMDVERL